MIRFSEIAQRLSHLNHYRTFADIATEHGAESQRTFLIPVPSRAHGEFLEAFMGSAGIRFEPLPVEDEECLAIGRRFTNRGQCAPVVYLTGNLIKYLLKLRQQGMTNAEILRDYAFLMVKTSGGACRLPTYEEEYRKALAAIGLDEFVIELVDIGLSKQSVTGLRIDQKFYIRIFLALMLGDIINDMERRIRPYECNPGETDAVMDKIKALIGESYSDDSEHKLVQALKCSRAMIEAIPVNLDNLSQKSELSGSFMWRQRKDIARATCSVGWNPRVPKWQCVR